MKGLAGGKRVEREVEKNRRLVCFRTTINVFLCIAQIGGFAVYILFIAKNFQSVFNSIYGWDLNYRVYLAIILVPTVLIWYPAMLLNIFF